MAGVNKAILVGHVGRDPEFRRTQGGDPVASFSLATSETWRDKNTGERKERTAWHPVVVFNENLCDVVEKYVRKGSKLYIEGQILPRKWTDKDGNERYTTEIVLQRFRGEITLLDSQSNRPPAADSADDYGNTRTRDDGPRDMADAERQYAQRGGRDLNAEADRAYDRNVAGAGAPLNDSIPFAPEWR